MAGLVNLTVLAGAAPADAAPPRIVVLGDSLTAGYGLAGDDAFPARLQAALKADGIEARVVNAGVSGDTTAAGLRRLDWALATGADGPPAALIVELGANDGLRGLDPKKTEANLDAIVTRAKAQGLKVLLTGMKAPPNYGRDYAAEFDAMFPRLAARHGVPLYPFFLDGVAAERSLNQADGLHPTPAGVAVIVERILPYVKRLIDDP
ncbi:arylesterase [Shumkonia mesophila]|uniref:arylesterase n=1 Tax=Shumkonia mesophila TaxID=2838854 RepID=UPI002934A27E|nr:arylesterase [Shumkonia mesophila]